MFLRTCNATKRRGVVRQSLEACLNNDYSIINSNNPTNTTKQTEFIVRTEMILNQRDNVTQIGVKLISTCLCFMRNYYYYLLKKKHSKTTYLIASNDNQILEIKLLFDTILT